MTGKEAAAAIGAGVFEAVKLALAATVGCLVATVILKKVAKKD